MIKRFRIQVEGRSYDVTVETDDEPDAASPTIPTPAHAPPLLPSPLAVSPHAPCPAASDPGVVPSPLAGRVTAINVQAGQEVNEGEHLVTLEAMKMNTFVLAPRAGKVRELKVSVGSAVDEGQALVALG